MSRLLTLRSVFKNIIRLGLTASVVLALSLSASSDFGKRDMPKDADLVDLFRSHRDAFERLATMAIEDTGTFSSISVEALNKEPLTGGLQSLSLERRSEYKRLLSSIKSDLVMGIDTFTRSVSFSYWRGGTGLSIGRSWEKGIAYLAHGPERVGRVVPSLDKPPLEDDVYLVPIEPKWYIMYVQLD
jgi:hypothetical protein